MILSVLKRLGQWAMALVIVASLGACRPGLCPEAIRVNEGYKGECLGKVDYYADRARVEISPKPECPWERLIDLRIFEGFRPGMTIGEARQRFGPPNLEADTSSRRIWKYRRQKGVIQIGHEDQGSAIIPFYYWWVLRAYPKDHSLHAIFPREVVDGLPHGSRSYEIVVLNQCHHPMVEVIVGEGKVQLMTWIDNPGSYRPGSAQG